MNLTEIQKRIMALFDPPEAGAAAGSGVLAAGDPRLGQVVVWYDPQGEFSEACTQLDLPGVEVFREEPSRLFELKRALNADLAGRRILVHRERPEGDLRDNWLADVEVFATPFKADYLSMLMADVGAADSAKMRDAVSACRAWLGKKANAKRLRDAAPGGFAEPGELYLAVMACVLGRDVPANRVEVVAAYLGREFDAECEARGLAGEGPEDDGGSHVAAAGPEAALKAAGVWGQLRGLLAACMSCDDEKLTAAEVRMRVFAAALADGVGPSGQAHLSPIGYLLPGEGARRRCREVVHAWKRRDARGLTRAAREAEAALHAPELVGAMPLDALVVCDALPCVDESVLSRLYAAACQPAFDAEAALSLTAQRKPLAWNGRLAPYYDALEALLYMRRFEAANPAGFFRAAPAEVWDAYTADWWRMDGCYRNLHRSAAAAYEDALDTLDDDLKEAVGYAEGLYKNWYLAGLARAWEQAAGEGLAAQGYADGVDRQDLFYMNEVAGTAKTGRVFVVVSDALRYEVAHELADVLEATMQGKAELSSAQAVFPSVTKCGIAALLPHGRLSLSVPAGGGDAAVLADGLPTGGTDERQTLLARASEGAVAVRYETLIGMRKDERKQLLEGARVVYVYHNRIDAVGDNAKTEREVFDACADAIEQLAGLVRLITGELRCANVVITADHGFIYTHEPLAESEKVALSQLQGSAVEVGRRYVLAAPGAECPAMAAVGMRLFGCDLAGFSPHACLRVAKPGAGQNYVHGGISLQELCVPVLRYRHRRSNARDFEAAAPSPLELVTTAATVTSNAFARDFFQKEPVGGKVVAATYEVVLVDPAGTPVTGKATLVADRTGDERSDRRLRATLSILPGVETSASREYRLLVRDARTGEVVLSVPQRVDIAFAQEDFGW